MLDFTSVRQIMQWREVLQSHCKSKVSKYDSIVWFCFALANLQFLFIEELFLLGERKKSVNIL